MNSQPGQNYGSNSGFQNAPAPRQDMEYLCADCGSADIVSCTRRGQTGWSSLRRGDLRCCRPSFPFHPPLVQMTTFPPALAIYPMLIATTCSTLPAAAPSRRVL
ncbi:hypothetical protein VTO73DRAFT_14634 [Trametes versicolor]